MRIAVGLSGGVDSSVACALLKEEGHEVIGMTMRVWEGAAEAIEDAKALKDACYGPGEEEDVAACRALCEKLGIPYHEIDLRAEYRERVIGYFKREYLEGRTPNPCVRCNAELKFGFLLERARQAGIAFDAFATGHYARILAAPSGRGLALARASDDSKDQSYFLYRLPPASLSSLRFPLGGLSKARVREIARSLGLAVADKAESQDFVASGYASLFDGGEGRPGDFVDDAGRAIGRHRGIQHYTIGQRRGLGVSAPYPLYVARIDPERNEITLSRDEGLYSDRLEASSAVINPEVAQEASFEAEAKIRQNHRPVRARIELLPEGRLRASFEAPVRAVAPGQSIVLYRGDFVAGGAIIESGR